MDFIDIVNNELKNNDNDTLNEYAFQISPMVAFAAFKDKAFGDLKRKIIGIKKNISKTASAIKGEALLAKEKVASTVVGKIGKGDNATLYRLTNEQMQVMAEIYRKYGKFLVDDILIFRRKILAPYQLIKRLVKKNKSLTSKETHGLSKEEFLAALESGRKKIELRGDAFYSKSDEINSKLARANESIKDLEKVLNDFKNERKLDNASLNRIFVKFEVSDEDLQGYTPEELRKIYDSIEADNRVIFSAAEKQKEGTLTLGDLDKVRQVSKDRLTKISGDYTRKEREKTVNQVNVLKNAFDLVKTEKEKFYRNGKFNVALGKYFLRRDILDKLKPGAPDSFFSKTYISIIEEMLKKEKEFKSNIVGSSISHRGKTNFTEKEALVWGSLPTAREFSGNLSDYYQKLKEEDFFDPKYVKKSDELLKAENDIETEIRRFERKLAKVVEPEDLAKLKKYRLINNMISVGELKDPENLFKTRAELEADKAEVKTNTDGDVPEKEDEEEEEKRNIPREEYYRRLKDFATKEYDSYKEFNDAKEKAKALKERMKEQGDDDVVEEYDDILQQFLVRKEIKKVELAGHKYDDSDILDINDITTLAKKIIRKNYLNANDAKQDVNSLKELIARYKEEDPNAKEDLDEIEFLMKRVDRKLSSEDFGKDEDKEKDNTEI